MAFRPQQPGPRPRRPQQAGTQQQARLANAAPAPDKQLAIPDAAAADPASFELLRVWVAEQAQQITLRPGIWQEPAAWGVFLADLARSIVQVHTDHDEELDAGAFLSAVLEGFDTEIESVLEEFGDGDTEAG